MLVGIISDGFNRSMIALEEAGAIDRTKMLKQYFGIGSKFYDLVTERIVYTAKYAAPDMRQLFNEEKLAPSINPDMSDGVSRMDPQRQEAYRHLLYTVLLSFRIRRCRQSLRTSLHLLSLLPSQQPCRKHPKTLKTRCRRSSARSQAQSVRNGCAVIFRHE